MAHTLVAPLLQPKLLADRLIRGEGLAWDAARVVAGSILMALCAQITIPLPWTPVPLTGQTFGVMVVAVLLGSKRGALAMLLYLAEGAAGLPVFATVGAPGLARFIGPTAGFLLSYPISACVTGWLVERYAASAKSRAIRQTALWTALAAGQVVVFALGWAWFMAAMNAAPVAAFYAAVLPFLLGDLIKMALVVAAVEGVELAASSGRVV